MAYIQGKTDCKRVAVLVQLVRLVGCGLDRWMIEVIEVRFLAGSRDISLLQSFQAKSLAHPASCSVDTRHYPQGWSKCSVRLTTHSHVVWGWPYTVMQCEPDHTQTCSVSLTTQSCSVSLTTHSHVVWAWPHSHAVSLTTQSCSVSLTTQSCSARLTTQSCSVRLTTHSHAVWGWPHSHAVWGWPHTVM